jgi:hypothetical protein
MQDSFLRLVRALQSLSVLINKRSSEPDATV